MHTQSLTGSAGAGDLEIEVTTAKSVSDTVPLGAAYALSPEQAAFFKTETGIDNNDDLKAHILDVQKKAYQVFPYFCIREFTFLWLGLASQPEYEQIIRLGKEHQDEILLDIGCCFGVDARKAVADGFPLRNVVTTDLFKAFFGLGHALFRTTPETYPMNFVPGDVFDLNTLQIAPPFDELPSTERPDLSTLTSLNPLAGRCAVIYISRFFHLFSEEKQLHLAKALAGLLSPRSGSTICGGQVGNQEKGLHRRNIQGTVFDMFQHSPKSWCALWDEIFPKGTVKVDVRLEPVETNVVSESYHLLLWSVVRL